MICGSFLLAALLNRSAMEEKPAPAAPARSSTSPMGPAAVTSSQSQPLQDAAATSAGCAQPEGRMNVHGSVPGEAAEPGRCSAPEH